LLGIITFFLGNFDWIHQVSRVAETCPNHIDESKMKGPYPRDKPDDCQMSRADPNFLFLDRELRNLSFNITMN
jgi:hypothetical protein